MLNLVKMNAQVLIKARKVFLQDKIIENSETCPHCASKGLDYKLRYYYISLDEAIYKCGRPTCLYPFERFIFKSLADSSEYYYEEVIEGGREAILRIPLDGQKLHEPKNPISTKVFTESQRNPDIESYDFSDFLDDFDIDSERKQEETATNSTAVNADFLDFLDDVETKENDTNTNKVLDEFGIDSFLNNILNESPVKGDQPTTSSKVENPVKKNVKLSKTIEHLQKVKHAKNIKKRTKPTETFTMAMLKAREDQSKSKTQQDDKQSKEIVLPGKFKDPNRTSVILSTKLSGVIKAKAAQKAKMDKSKTKKFPKKNETEVSQKLEDDQPTKNITMANLRTSLKSTNVIRPTALAKNLSSMDISKFGSNFLRTYMKTKEDQLFKDEPSGSSTTTSVVALKKSTDIVQKPSTSKESFSDDKVTQNTTVNVNETTGFDEAAVVKVPLKVTIRKERLIADAGKKVIKSRQRKPKSSNETKATDMKVEPIDDEIITFRMKSEQLADFSEVNIKGTKSSSKGKKDKVDSKSMDDKTKNLIEKLTSKSKRTCTVTSATSANKTIIQDLEAKKVSTKRPRKTKADKDSVTTENELQPKTKRKRGSKSKASVDSTETASMPFLFDTEPEIGLSSASHVEQKDQTDAKKDEISSNDHELIGRIGSTSSSSGDSLASLTPLLGFEPIEQKQAEFISEDVISQVNYQRTIPVEESFEKRSTFVEIRSESESNVNGSSKRPRKTAFKSKATTSNQSNYNRSLRSRKNSSKSADSVTIEVIIQQPSTSIPNDMEQENLIDVEMESSDDNSVFNQEPTTKNISLAEAVTSSSAASTKVEEKKKKPNNAAYYRRKIFKQKEESAFEVNNLVADWDDSSSEKTVDQSKTDKRTERIQSDEKLDDDAASTITIESGTSDSSVTIV